VQACPRCRDRSDGVSRRRQNDAAQSDFDGQHGHKIAVIENEFGPEGIDNELLVSEPGEQIIEMNNGCICCTCVAIWCAY
jgi:hypothetical protein